MQKFTVRKTIDINASKESVWRVLITPELFTQWASVFCPDSKMKGDWKKGGFVSYIDKNGMGLKGKIIEFSLHARITVEYVAVLKDFLEVPEQEKGWRGCRETYKLTEKNGITSLSIESEVPTKEFYDEFLMTWNKALSKIKELAEKNDTDVSTKIFVNLAVNDLDKSKKFFAKLGYSINPQFSNEQAVCIVISESIYVMLLVHDFFKTFTKKNICDSTKQTEVIIALSTTSRENVDEMAHRAVAAGGKIHREPEDHGWMYGQSFEDLDGHIWEVFWMDPNKIKDDKTT